MTWKSPKKPVQKPAQKPMPVSPRVDDLPPTAGGGFVNCAGCRQPRLRGTHCARCEWRAAEVLGA